MALLVAPAAFGQWSPPTLVAVAPALRSDPALSFDGFGHGLFSWEEFGDTGAFARHAVARRVDGTFGPATVFGPSFEPPLVYGRGRIVGVVDSHAHRGVRVRFGSASGRLGPARTVFRDPPGYLTQTAAAGNDRGDVAFVHLRVDGRTEARSIVVRERRAGRSFGAQTLIVARPACGPGECRGEGLSDAVAIALGPSGELVVAWQEGRFLKARVRRPGRPLEPAKILGRAVSVDAIRAAVSARGAIWVAWHDVSTGIEGWGPLTVRLAVRSAGSAAFGRTRILERNRETQSSFAAPLLLALDPKGDGFVAWSHSPKRYSHNMRVRLARLDVRGRVRGVSTVSTPRTYSVASGLVTGSTSGQALIGWTEELAPDDPAQTRVLAALVTSDGSVAPAEQLGEIGAHGLALAFDRHSSIATAVWAQRLVGERTAILSATGPRPLRWTR